MDVKQMIRNDKIDLLKCYVIILCNLRILLFTSEYTDPIQRH